jgi:hypothetical protein
VVTFDLACHGCGESFTAKSPSAKWCRPGCKKHKQRHPDPAAGELDELEPAETSLVAALRKELQDAGVLDTVDAQQALVLARSMTKVDASGISGLSKELSRVKAAALGQVPTVAAADEPADPDDELRNKRDAKRQAAREASS